MMVDDGKERKKKKSRWGWKWRGRKVEGWNGNRDRRRFFLTTLEPVTWTGLRSGSGKRESEEVKWDEVRVGGGTAD